jgi:hypothetical protein
MSREYAVVSAYGFAFVSDVDVRQYMTENAFVSTTTGGAGIAGYVNIWGGSSWLLKPMKSWTGAVWAVKPVKFWNGTTWELT